jgi:GYF domain 2
MVDRWYYAHDEARLGPYSSEQLKELAAAGKILTTDTVWQEGVEKGALAAKVRYLFVAVASPPVIEGSEVAPVVSVAALLEAAQEFAGKPEPAKAPKEKNPRPPSPVRRGTAVSGAGVIIVGQDGITVKYRKKCTTCGHEDTSWSTMKIMSGSTRVSFFCPKCRKNRAGEIRGSVS